jgi:hypothetical protein
MAQAALEGDEAEYRSAVEQALDSVRETNRIMTKRLQLIRNRLDGTHCEIREEESTTTITMNIGNFNALMELLG